MDVLILPHHYRILFSKWLWNYKELSFFFFSIIIDRGAKATSTIQQVGVDFDLIYTLNHKAICDGNLFK
jgi:hypothetical protein